MDLPWLEGKPDTGGSLKSSSVFVCLCLPHDADEDHGQTETDTGCGRGRRGRIEQICLSEQLHGAGKGGNRRMQSGKGWRKRRILGPGQSLL